MLTLTAHISTADIRRESTQDGEFLVVPVVAVREQVLNGEFLPAEELRQPIALNLWEGTPITVPGHPTQRGQQVSAGHRWVQEKMVIGRLHNVEFRRDPARMVAEMWLDTQKARQVPRGQEALERLEAAERGEREPVEVSTGYFRSREEVQGQRTHDGKRFNAIQRNIIPDHLAILLDQTGACSVDDGCGAPRVNEDGDTEPEGSMDPADDEREAFQAFRKFWGLITNASSTEEGTMENRDQVITTLAEDDSCPFDREELEDFSDPKLEFMASDREDGGDDADAGDGAEDTPAGNAGDGADDGPEDQVVTASAAADALGIPEGTIQVLRDTDPESVKNALAAQTQKKEKLVRRLAANDDVAIPQDDLEAMSVEGLEALADQHGTKNGRQVRPGPSGNTDDGESEKVTSHGMSAPSAEDRDKLAGAGAE